MVIIIIRVLSQQNSYIIFMSLNIFAVFLLFGV
jgi:hypothetical protein